MGATEQQQQRNSLQRAILIVFIVSLLVAYCFHEFIIALSYQLHQFLTRKCIFFSCNVILLFLALDSGMLGFFKTLTDKGFDDYVPSKSNHVQADGPEFTATHVVLAESEALGVEQREMNDRDQREVVIFEESETLYDKELKRTDKGLDDYVPSKSNHVQADGLEFKETHVVLAESEALGAEQGEMNDRDQRGS